MRSLPGNNNKIQEKLQWSALKLEATKHTQMTQMCHNQNLHTHTLSQPAMRDSFKGN